MRILKIDFAHCSCVMGGEGWALPSGQMAPIILDWQWKATPCEALRKQNRSDTQRRERVPVYHYMDLTGGVPLPRVTFWAQIPQPRVYFWQKFITQGYIFHPKSLDKGMFLTKTPKNWHFGAKLVSIFGKFLLKGEYLGWNSLKSCKDGLMIRKCSLAKGMFSTKISLAKGIRSKNRSRTRPSKIFLSTPHHTSTGTAVGGARACRWK